MWIEVLYMCVMYVRTCKDKLLYCYKINLFGGNSRIMHMCDSIYVCM